MILQSQVNFEPWIFIDYFLNWWTSQIKFNWTISFTNQRFLKVFWFFGTKRNIIKIFLANCFLFKSHTFILWDQLHLIFHIFKTMNEVLWSINPKKTPLKSKFKFRKYWWFKLILSIFFLIFHLFLFSIRWIFVLWSKVLF